MKRQPWQYLRVGDWVHIVRMPSGRLLPETVRVYRRLLRRGTPSRVFQIDEYGHPWIYCRFRRKDGTFDIHWLAINDDSWERAVKR